MKRPEYVAIVTGIYAKALREGREPTAEEVEILKQAFSRQGFTDGYHTGRKGPDMFGVRQEEKEPKELYAQARASYENGEERKEPVRFYALIQPGQPALVAVEDRQGRVARVEGPAPEEARNVPLTREKVEEPLLERLCRYCDEFLVHAVDVEGKSGGIEAELAALLGKWDRTPVTYAGGVHSYGDLELLRKLGGNRVNVTIGSALDLFGGPMSWEKVLDMCRNG